MANKFPEWLKSLGTRRADLPPAVRGQPVRHTIVYPGDQTSAVLVGKIKATPDATSELALWSVGAGVFDGTETRWEVSLTGGQTLSLPDDGDFDGVERLVSDFLITQDGFSQRVFGGLFTLSGFVTEDGTTPAPPPDPEEAPQFATQEYVDNAIAASEFLTIKIVPDATYTAEAGDVYLRFTNAGGCAFTLPENGVVAIPVGKRIYVEQSDDDPVTIGADVGVTVESRGGAFDTGGQWAVAVITKVATNEWILTGDIA